MTSKQCNLRARSIVYEVVERVVPASSSEHPGAFGASFEQLYRAQWASLVRLALAISGSRELAEDAVHEVFLRVGVSLEHVERPEAYLRTAVLNALRDRQRRRMVELRRPQPVPARIPEHEIDETWSALQSLPERYRAALVLRYYADLAIEEVAEQLGCPLGTAKSLIHRGLRLLKERLQP
jgi:RNA polymerase sigma factor (sigma-70 family)